MPYRGSYEQDSTRGGGANWLGFQEVALTDIVDRSADFPNLEMFLEIHFRNSENSQYPWKYSLLGSFDRDDTGKIDGDNGFLKRILYFTDAIGWSGGVNTKGEWVDENDKDVEDIAALLNSQFTEHNYGSDKKSSSDPHKYYIFTYKKWNPNAKKAYMTVVPKIVQNNTKGRNDLESYIKYMKANKFIVEHDDTQNTVSNGDMSSTTTGTPFNKF
jgi:hypothetical protein